MNNTVTSIIKYPNSNEIIYSTFQRSTFQRSTFQRSTFQRSTFQRSTFQRSIFQRSTFQRSTQNSPPANPTDRIAVTEGSRGLQPTV